MNRDALFVRKILQHAEVFDWSLQGFGMFRLYLSKETRLHVWDSRFATENVSTIHTHPWHFRSTVIAGELTDRVFFREIGSDAPTHHLQKIVCGPGGCAVGDREDTRLELLQEVLFKRGDRYSLTATTFHETRADLGTITIIDRDFTEDTEHAFVCFPIGTSWVSAEPRTATPSEVRTMAEMALYVLENP